MTVIDKIRLVVETIGGLSFMYDDWNRVNKRADMLVRSNEPVSPDDTQAEGRLPSCFVILPASGQFDTRAANYRDAPDLQICFCIDSELDFDGLQNDTLVEQMKLKCKQFIAAYNDSGMFEPLPDLIDYRPLYDILEANLTGVYINIRAFEVAGYCVDDLLNV